MRRNSVFAVLLVAVAPSLATHAGPTPTDNFACNAIASTLPPRGTRLSAKTIDQVIAELPGSVLNLESTAVSGLTLESTYGGSLNCQRNNLFERTQGGRQQVAIPERFQGGEGALCGADKVQLVAVNRTPALLEAAWNGDDRVDLDIALRNGSDWSMPCRLSVETTPKYGITERFCIGDECQALGMMAVEVADTRDTDDPYKQAYRASQLSGGNQKIFARMVQLADARQLIGDELPTFGRENTNGNLRSFLEWDTVFIPVELGGDLLLGKIGKAGFGSHFGSDELFAAYRLVGDQFQPVAGFYLSVVAQSLDGYQVTNSP